MMAGDPTAVAPFGTGFNTNDPAPTITLEPIVIFPNIVTLHPRKTLSPIFG